MIKAHKIQSPHFKIDQLRSDSRTKQKLAKSPKPTFQSTRTSPCGNLHGIPKSIKDDVYIQRQPKSCTRGTHLHLVTCSLGEEDTPKVTTRVTCSCVDLIRINHQQWHGYNKEVVVQHFQHQHQFINHNKHHQRIPFQAARRFKTQVVHRTRRTSYK